MKNISKKILYIIAAVMTFLLVFSSIASERPVSFPDVPTESRYYESVTYFAGKGIVSGQKDGRFHPEEIMTVEEWDGILNSLRPALPKPHPSQAPISPAGVYESIWRLAGLKTYSAAEYGIDSDLDAGTTAMIATGFIRRNDVRRPNITRGEAVRLLYEVTVKKSAAEVPSDLIEFFNITLGEDCSTESETLIRTLLKKVPNNQLALMLVYGYSFNVQTQLSVDSINHTVELGVVDQGNHIINLREDGIEQALIHEVGHVIEDCNVSYSTVWKLNKEEGPAAVRLLGNYAGKNANEFIAEATRYFLEHAGDEVAMAKMESEMPKTYAHLAGEMNADSSVNESQFLSIVYGTI